MNRAIVVAVLLTLAAVDGATAAESGNSNKVFEAVTKLQAAPNFSWTTTIKMPGSPWEMGPLKARTEKDGYTFTTQEVGGFETEVVFKGDKIVIKQDGEWRTREELDGFQQIMAGVITRNGTAAQEATNMLAKAKELKAEDGGLLSAEYTDEGAKALLSFGGPGAPGPKNAKGSIKFWLKDDALAKFESHLKGDLAGPDGGEQPFEMIRTFEIQEVGSTKVNVPEGAKTKLEPKKEPSAAK